MGAGLFVDVGDEGLLAAAAIVVDGLLAASGEELDGGVGLDAVLRGDGLAVGSLGIDLGNDDILLVDKVGGDRVPDGGELLAVCSWSAIDSR